MLRILSSALNASSARSTHVSPDLSGSAGSAHLPVIAAGGFEAHALSVVGETQEDTGKTYIAYLSLLGPGTAVAAIWAALMDQRQLAITLEEVGPIQLWQRQPALATLGYAIPWRRRIRVLQLAHGARLAHLVTEPDLLTIRIPEEADARGRKRRRGADSAAGDARSARDAQVSGDPRTGQAKNAPHTRGDQREPGGQAGRGGQEEDAAAIEQMSEQVAQETRPLFVLLGQRGENETTLARRHLLFLAERIQWLAYYEPWAAGLWKRGLQTGEIRPLTVWPTPNLGGASDQNNYSNPGNSSAAAEGSCERWITSAYCCQPDPLALAADLPMIVQAARPARVEPVEPVEPVVCPSVVVSTAMPTTPAMPTMPTVSAAPAVAAMPATQRTPEIVSPAPGNTAAEAITAATNAATAGDGASSEEGAVA